MTSLAMATPAFRYIVVVVLLLCLAPAMAQYPKQAGHDMQRQHSEQRADFHPVAVDRRVAPLPCKACERGRVRPDPCHDCTTKHDPCCPPWNVNDMQNTLVATGGSLSSPYSLSFQHSSVDAALQAYINYLYASGIAHSITIYFTVYDAGAGGAGSSPSAGGPQVGATHSWGWTAPNPSGAMSFTLPGGGVQLQPNHWYTVGTSILLDGGKTSFYGKQCMTNAISFNHMVGLAARGASGNGPRMSAADSGLVFRVAPQKIGAQGMGRR